MEINQAVKIAATVMSTATVQRGERWWLCLQSRQLVAFPRKEIPDDGIKVYEFNYQMSVEGLSCAEWDKLESKLKQFLKGGLL